MRMESRYEEKYLLNSVENEIKLCVYENFMMYWENFEKLLVLDLLRICNKEYNGLSIIDSQFSLVSILQ